MTERKRKPRTPSRRRVPAPSHSDETSAVHPLIALQHTAGNHAVTRLLEPARSLQAPGAATIARTTEPVVARDEADEVTAANYLQTFAEQIGNGVRDFLLRQEFPLPDAHLSWKDPATFVRDALTGGSPLSATFGGPALTGRLPELLKPIDVRNLVNRGRKQGVVQVTDDKKTWTEERTDLGPEKWFPDVAVEIGQVLAERLTASLARMAPRYLDARVAAAIAAESAHNMTLITVPEPKGPLLTSAPVDELTAAALRSGNVLFDWPGYHMANPTAVGDARRPRQLLYDLEDARHGTYWIRVRFPADPTPEEVALELFGSTTMTSYIGVSAPPLFGFGDARPLNATARAAFAANGIDLSQTGDPAAAGMKGPLADEIALGQAKAVPGTAKADVLQTMGQSLIILDKFIEIGAAFGLGKDPSLGDIQPVRAKLVAKRTELGAAEEAKAAAWSGQANAQKDLLSQASFGFGGLVERFQSMTKTVADATAKLGGFTLPAYTRDAMHDVAMLYVDAASASFFPGTGEEKLAVAERANRLVPIKILEGTLAGIRRAADDALTDKRKEGSSHASYGAEGLRSREIDLRARLANAREVLLRDPTAAAEVLGKLQEEILDLQTETEMVTNMDQLDAAWQALEDSISVFVSSSTHEKIGALHAETEHWHGRWTTIFRLWKTGDADNRAKAKTELDKLRADQQLSDYFARVKSVVEDARTQILIGKIIAMLVITIVTAGVGEFAAGVAAGYELSAGWTAVAVGGAEAVTFTTLSQIMIDTDHSAGHIAWELASNLAMFASMRRFSAFAEAAKLSKFAAATGQAVLLGAMGLAKEEIAKYATTGRHLTREEIGKIALQSLVMFVALQGVGKFAEPILTNIKAEGTMLGLRRNAANRAAKGLKEMQQALLGSKDPAKALEYIDAERKWLDLKIKAYEELELAAAAEARASAKSGKPPKDGGVLKRAGMTMADIAEMKGTLGKSAQTMAAARMMITLEPGAPDTYFAPRSRMAEVLADIGDHTLIKTDADGVRTWEAKSPDGRKITITESLDKYERFELELRKGLTDRELEKLGQMSGRKSPKEIYDMFGGDKDAAIARIKREVAATQAKKNRDAASLTRAAELKLQIADNKIMQDPEISALVKGMTKANRGQTISDIRDRVMAKILGGEALARAQASEPDAELLTGVKIFERQPEATIAEWKANHPGETDQGLTMRPDPAGGPDALYRQRGEIDVMVVVPEPGGKARIMHREEIKTGTTDKPSAAKKQLDEIGRLLGEGSSGNIRLELPDKTNITPGIDMASDATATKATRGPSDKMIKTSPADTEGFDESLGITSGDLERLIKALLDEAVAADKAGGGGDTK